MIWLYLAGIVGEVAVLYFGTYALARFLRIWWENR